MDVIPKEAALFTRIENTLVSLGGIGSVGNDDIVTPQIFEIMIGFALNVQPCPIEL
jgi:hypothetical protein